MGVFSALLLSSETSAADAPPPAGCDTLSISFRGAQKKFSKEMQEVETRINQICDQRLPKMDETARNLGKECAGSTAGSSSDADVSIDLRVQNFENRSKALCTFLKEAKSKIRPDAESFCGKFSSAAARTSALFANSNEANQVGPKAEVIARITGLKKDHLATAIVYNGVATNAGQVRAPIDRSLPESSDNNSRTTDKGLQYLLELTEKARAAREAQLKKEYAQLGAANPPPADRDAKAAAMQKSASACGRLKRELVQYKELMEANLLPNGRRMSKLLTEAEISTKAEAEKHTAQAAKMDEILKRLETPSDSALVKPGAVAAVPRPDVTAADQATLARAEEDRKRLAAGTTTGRALSMRDHINPGQPLSSEYSRTVLQEEFNGRIQVPPGHEPMLTPKYASPGGQQKLCYYVQFARVKPDGSLYPPSGNRILQCP